MNYQNFAIKTRRLSYFKKDVLQTFLGNQRTLNNQLVAWQRQGKIHKLKKGIYTLNEEERRAPLTALMISNLIYAPSYISLESALSYFALIPERVVGITAVTPHKTATFQNFYGYFSYRSIKTNYFFGFQSIHDAGDMPVLIATPEKAILDKVYFDTAFKPFEDYFLENLRLQNYEKLRIKMLTLYGRKFDCKKITRAISVLADMIRKEKK